MIRYTLFSLSILCFVTFLNAQEAIPLQRSITVTGSADMVVTPDEIELSIELVEYNDKVNLQSIEKAFYKILAKNNISKEKVTFNNSGYTGIIGGDIVMKTENGNNSM